VELPENFDSNEVSKRWRVDGDEGMCSRDSYNFHSYMFPFYAGWRPICAKKRRKYAPQASGNQAQQDEHLVSFRSQTVGL
jgi:hypothetical protein